jgi:hypothetical protein
MVAHSSPQHSHVHAAAAIGGRVSALQLVRRAVDSNYAAEFQKPINLTDKQTETFHFVL